MKPTETAPEGASGGQRYRFGEVIVDEAAHTLVRAGEPQTVEPKAFAVLLVLLRRAGELVGRDELLDAVWGHRHVTPGVLTRAIAQLRHALGDDFHHPVYIQTQHALGYRFVGTLQSDTEAETRSDVPDGVEAAALAPALPLAAAFPPEPDITTVPPIAETVATDPVPRVDMALHGTAESTGMRRAPPAKAVGDRDQRWRWLGAAVAVLVLAIAATLIWQYRQSPSARPGEASIAILPFTSLSNTRDDRYFAEGLAVEMHDALAGVPGLEVVAARPAAKGDGNEIDVKKLGRRLGVATVLDASVRRALSRVRISARLTDTKTGVTLWAGSYDRETGDVFAVQSEIASEVVQALLGMLPGGGQSLTERLAPTHSIVAYDAYLKGLQQLQE
ncbi:MAG: winged helix-turn-helix domain-containing protein, partial [Lysobacter sp.]